ncbi:hypothetical protein LLEC1_07267 [Akanthomyces lecanii]|uniref:SMP-30/Gluconolactonase/LRE-like region domain-containing protein n=1 Tax=Cordyceps confragosa TaxID=2714763 RepID=A0A179IDX8_CORDF|nr:hypothetical protein LLEC1_07267 [Akanthomyces lecanii]
MRSFIRTVAFAPLLLLSAIPSATSSATPNRGDNSTSSAELSNRLIVELPGTWLENIAVRPNGNLLLTTLSPNATLYEVSKLDSDKPTIDRVFTADSVTAFLGISEIGVDKYAIAAGNLTEDVTGIEGSWGVWTVDFASSCGPKPQKPIPIPSAKFLNGLSSVPGHDDLALVADSATGVAYHVNITSGEAKISQDFDEMKAAPGGALPIGLNGLHMRKGHLYFTNLSTHTFFRVKANSDGTTADGAKVETVAKIASQGLDDFIFGPGEEDTAWLATNADGSLVATSLAGEQRVFGRSAADGKVLYVATGEGKVQAFDTSKFAPLRSVADTCN